MLPHERIDPRRWPVKPTVPSHLEEEMKRDPHSSVYNPEDVWHNKGAEPYHSRTHVRSARFMKPVSKLPPLEPPDLEKRSPLRSPRDGTPLTSEKWRERGMQRWPPFAEEESRRRPAQFIKTEDIVPLQRFVENPEAEIGSEIWRRSLRSGRSGLHAAHVGHFKIQMPAVKDMFNSEGLGFSGRTNTTTSSGFSARSFTAPSAESWDRSELGDSVSSDEMAMLQKMAACTSMGLASHSQPLQRRHYG